jgi:hypothetical protein
MRVKITSEKIYDVVAMTLIFFILLFLMFA